MHFVAFFWEFDATNSQFRKAFDIWSNGLVAYQLEELDNELSIREELIPALLLGKMDDPMWDIAEMCAGESLFFIISCFNVILLYLLFSHIYTFVLFFSVLFLNRISTFWNSFNEGFVEETNMGFCQMWSGHSQTAHYIHR